MGAVYLRKDVPFDELKKRGFTETPISFRRRLGYMEDLVVSKQTRKVIQLMDGKQENPNKHHIIKDLVIEQ